MSVMPERQLTVRDETPDWERRLAYRRLELDPALRRGLDRFWQRQHERDLARQRGPQAPGQETPEPAVATLPEDLARKAIAEGGDREAVGRAQKEQAGRPIRATVVTGVYRGRVAAYDRRTDEAVVVDDRPPAATERQRSGTAWLSGSATGDAASPQTGLAETPEISAVTLPRDRRRPQDAPGLDL